MPTGFADERQLPSVPMESTLPPLEVYQDVDTVDAKVVEIQAALLSAAKSNGWSKATLLDPDLADQSSLEMKSSKRRKRYERLQEQME